MSEFIVEPIFHIGSFPFTNTLLDVLIIDTVIIVAALNLKKNLSVVPGAFQNVFEYITESFYNLTQSISPKHASRIFPYFMTFFLFILLTNLSGLIPGISAIGFYRDGKLIPFVKAATSDINLTLGLALVSAVATHFMSINILGIKEYLSRYFSINPVYLFVGILELVGEITKVISLSFRLFGNIYAGEAVLATISGLFAKLPAVVFIGINSVVLLPFVGLEIIVGLVQALVFSMLTCVFMAILTTSHHDEQGIEPNEGSLPQVALAKGGDSHEH